MKVKLVNPVGMEPGYKTMGVPHLVSLASFLEARTGVRAELIEANLEDQPPAEWGLGDADVVGVSCYTSYNYAESLALAAGVKRHNPEAKLVVGGYHASAMASDFLRSGSPYDFVVQGEGEVALARLVGSLMRGEDPGGPVLVGEPVADLDALPPYDWSFLERYRERMNDSPGQAQIYLSRGCPYRCTFCMERCKGEVKWRAYSPARAVDELRRYADFIHFDRVVTLADPLFGLNRSWRREVLERIRAADLGARAYWTLTRIDTLDEDDVRLYGQAGFCLGFGMESGSPEMLAIMDKARDPRAYLDRVRVFRDWCERHRVTWGANILLGHPGETPETMAQTGRFLLELFLGRKVTLGWMSADPFRLYPGSRVAENQADYTRALGTRFHLPRWWWDPDRSRRSFSSEFIDPSSELTYEERVQRMYAAFAPILREVRERFIGFNPRIRDVLDAGMAEQIGFLSDRSKARLLGLAAAARSAGAGQTGGAAQPAIGSTVQATPGRLARRVAMVASLTERGLLTQEPVIQAMLEVDREHFVPVEHRARAYDEVALALPGDGNQTISAPHAYAIAFEALGLGPGGTYLDVGTGSGYGLALASRIVGERGVVCGIEVDEPTLSHARSRLEGAGYPVDGLVLGDGRQGHPHRARFEAIWVAACCEEVPAPLARCLEDGGRLVVAVGAQGGAQQLVLVTRRGDRFSTRSLGATRYVPLVQTGAPTCTPRGETPT